jgi:hypothetical protein
MRLKFSPARRRASFLGALALLGVRASPSAVAAAVAATAAPPVRLAFLLGNRDYPAQQDLPPITKNVRDLKAALEAKGFAVTDALNLDLASAKAAIATFARNVSAAPADATIFFYFSGHGVQDEARNLLVSANVNPSLVDQVKLGSLDLGGDVVGPLAPRAAGATYAVIDACRVEIRAAVKNRDGLNQVEAPAGCLIAFSTGAGKPAISPNVETENTFYTHSLVKVLNEAADTISFKDMFDRTRKDVRETMLNHKLASVRALAQDPFIADNTLVSVPLSLKVAEPPPRTPTLEEQEALWAQIQQSVWPADIAKLAKSYLEQYPEGLRVQSVEVALDGAVESAKLLKGINLYRSSFQNLAALDESTQRDVYRAARGDKDAAKRIGLRFKSGASETELGRYVAWLQYASGLGNGIASYDMALHYRRQDQPDLAARFEVRAREQGFTPPPSLERGK